ncbi:hypothetical protein NQU17_12040 [Clostridiaceae bacterium HFYG-1003]|nr:hypothetical protein NQU17_12040 [Clostridiaceae bacterium HFYG-1003]
MGLPWRYHPGAIRGEGFPEPAQTVWAGRILAARVIYLRLA